MVAGVFGLKRVYKKQRLDEWPEDSNYGYFFDGSTPNPSPPPGIVSTAVVDRLDLYNETTSLPGSSLTQTRVLTHTVSSNSYGYIAGGLLNPASLSPNKSSIIDRLDFSNETILNPPTAKLPPSGSQTFATVSTPEYGYFGGGFDSSTLSIIDRLDFSSETLSTLPAVLPAGRSQFTAVSSSDYGYFGGGTPGSSPVCTIDRLDFSNETTSNPPASLSENRRLHASVSNSSYGYFGGGFAPTNPPPTYVSTIDRIDFSNETVTVPGNHLLQKKMRLAGVHSSNYGYFALGVSSTPTILYHSNIDRLDFFNETLASPGNPLPLGRYNSEGLSSGKSGKNVKHLPKTTGTDVDGKPISSTYGYFGGGDGLNCTIDRLDFSNETTIESAANLTQAKEDLAAVSSSSYGYFGAGETAGIRICTIDRLDFSNETTSRVTATLPQGRHRLAAVSSNSYGYFGGGQVPPIVDKIDRIDFSNETTSAPGNNLPQARYGLAAVSSSSYGYFGAGYAPGIPDNKSTVDRIDFSNETMSAPGNNLSQARRYLAAVSNSNYGYFAGGDGSPPPLIDTVDRLDFSNETTSTPGNNLPESNASLAAVSNNSYGYFGGGKVPPNNNEIQRIDFSNESMSQLSNSLSGSESRSELAALSN